LSWWFVVFHETTLMGDCAGWARGNPVPGGVGGG
jgi:hypothetical protein